jgi:hypothetical protein
VSSKTSDCFPQELLLKIKNKHNFPRELDFYDELVNIKKFLDDLNLNAIPKKTQIINEFKVLIEKSNDLLNLLEQTMPLVLSKCNSIYKKVYSNKVPSDIHFSTTYIVFNLQKLKAICCSIKYQIDNYSYAKILKAIDVVLHCFCSQETSVTKEYDLCLMSELPVDGDIKKPELNKVYFEKKDNKLAYIVLSPNGAIAERTLDITIEGDLTKNFLNSKKNDILKATSNKDYAQKVKRIDVTLIELLNIKIPLEKIISNNDYCGYELDLMSDGLILDKRKIYIGKTSDGALKYTILTTTNGVVVNDTINIDQLSLLDLIAYDFVWVSSDQQQSNQETEKIYIKKINNDALEYTVITSLDGYDLALMSELQSQQQLEQGKLYIKLEDGVIQYKVLDGGNIERFGQIIAKDIDSSATFPISDNLDQFSQIKKDILKVTSNRGHTHTLNNGKLTSAITIEELPVLVKSEENFNSDLFVEVLKIILKRGHISTINANYSIENIKPLLPKILQITSDRGHTRYGFINTLINNMNILLGACKDIIDEINSNKSILYCRPDTGACFNIRRSNVILKFAAIFQQTLYDNEKLTVFYKNDEYNENSCENNQYTGNFYTFILDCRPLFEALGAQLPKEETSVGRLLMTTLKTYRILTKANRSRG